MTDRARDAFDAFGERIAAALRRGMPERAGLCDMLAQQLDEMAVIDLQANFDQRGPACIDLAIHAVGLRKRP